MWSLAIFAALMSNLDARNQLPVLQQVAAAAREFDGEIGTKQIDDRLVAVLTIYTRRGADQSAGADNAALILGGRISRLVFEHFSRQP